jgi:hypothetical protein
MKFEFMKSWKGLNWCLGAASTMLCVVPAGWAEAKPNPYNTITVRNPFGLKDPPIAQAPVEVKPAAPPAKVILTGVTSLSGAPKCFLEITEQEPGKAANVLRPILQAGEGAGPVEVVSIDVEKNMVRIKNGGQESDLKFEDPNKIANLMANVGPRPPVPGVPPPAFHAPAQPTAAPTIISPASADNSSRNSSVTMFGNQADAAQPNGIPSALGVTDGGGRILPTRPNRSQSQGTTDPAAQYVNTMLQTKHYEQKGISMPPIPPVPGTQATPPPVPGQ